MNSKKPLILVLLLVGSNVSAQNQWQVYKNKLIYFSIAPSFGTNGTHPGGYIDNCSLHVTSGYSGGNRGIEIAGFSNLNVEMTYGLQFAGLVNVTGGNAFAGLSVKDIRKKIQQGFEANLIGGQFSGILNVIQNNAFGIQATGLI